jgi:hypothetical protein
MRAATVALGFLVWCGPAVGQTIPVTAKVRETRQVSMQGMNIETRVQEGHYYRSSSGVTLEEWTSVTINGRVAKGTGFLTDPNSKKNFHLDFGSSIAREEPLNPGSPPDSDPEVATKIAAARPASVVQRTIEGIPCTVNPMYILDPPSKELTLVGEACHSESYKLTLSYSTKRTSQDGKTTVIQYELFAIQLNREPDPAVFNLRERGFTIYGPLPQ